LLSAAESRLLGEAEGVFLPCGFVAALAEHHKVLMGSAGFDRRT
jgi:hypothetical protein